MSSDDPVSTTGGREGGRETGYMDYSHFYQLVDFFSNVSIMRNSLDLECPVLKAWSPVWQCLDMELFGNEGSDLINTLIH